MSYADQTGFDVRCEWGERGVQTLAPISDVVIIVDVLSFSTCVDIATANGALVFPYWCNDASATEFARSKHAELAGARSGPSGQFSLSPCSLLTITRGTRLILPSPNGAALTLSTGTALTLAGCLRNCQAAAEFACRHRGSIAVIPAGERWDDGSLRPAVEDLIGAGAILSFLSGTISPEAHGALAAFDRARADLAAVLLNCSSGRELVERGFQADVEIAAQFNVSDSAPLFRDGAYVNRNPPER